MQVVRAISVVAGPVGERAARRGPVGARPKRGDAENPPRPAAESLRNIRLFMVEASSAADGFPSRSCMGLSPTLRQLYDSYQDLTRLLGQATGQETSSTILFIPCFLSVPGWDGHRTAPLASLDKYSDGVIGTALFHRIMGPGSGANPP